MSAYFSEPTAQVTVRSSDRREAYFVTHFKGKKQSWECECATWRTLHRRCKHVELAISALRSRKVDDVVIDIWGTL